MELEIRVFSDDISLFRSKVDSSMRRLHTTFREKIIVQNFKTIYIYIYTVLEIKIQHLKEDKDNESFNITRKLRNYNKNFNNSLNILYYHVDIKNFLLYVSVCFKSSSASCEHRCLIINIYIIHNIHKYSQCRLSNPHVCVLTNSPQY